jgi:hypothetical protein
MLSQIQNKRRHMLYLVFHTSTIAHVHIFAEYMSFCAKPCLFKTHAFKSIRPYSSSISHDNKASKTRAPSHLANESNSYLSSQPGNQTPLLRSPSRSHFRGHHLLDSYPAPNILIITSQTTRGSPQARRGFWRRARNVQRPCWSDPRNGEDGCGRKT